MMRIVLPLLMSFLLVYGGGEHGHEHEHEHEHGEVPLEEIHLTEEQIKDLGIELYTVRKEPAGRLINIPAEVKENPLLSYAVFSPVEGIIRKLYVKEGDWVEKGTPVAEIYSPELADLVGELEMARVRMETAKKIYERDKELYAQRVIQYTRFYTSMVNYERAEGEFKALRERLKSYGDVKGYHLILRSPGEGYVVSQNVVLGESVGPDRELFRIHFHKVLWVYGWADERSAREIKEGMRAEVTLSDSLLPCRIDFIGHEVDEKTRRVKIRCVAHNRKHLLKPGMFVTLKVRTGKEKAILVPKTAVQDIEGKKILFVWKEDHFEPRELHILREVNGYYVVEEGVSEGERVAVSGTVFLKTKLVGVEEAGHAH